MMQQSINAAVVQMSSSADVQQNLGEARRWVHQAARDGATLICLPEYFCWIGDDEMQRVALAEAFGDGPIQQALSELARETGAWLIGGTVPIRPAHGPQAGTHAYNTSLVFDPSGQCSARYDKIHLFSFNQGAEQHAEGDTMVGGDSIGTAQGPFGTLRLSVCYDLRFPELYRAAPDADVIAVPAAFTHTTGLAHWELLLRARRRKPGLRARIRSVRHAFEWLADFWTQYDRRAVGRGARAARRRARNRARDAHTKRARRSAQSSAGAHASAYRYAV